MKRSALLIGNSGGLEGVAIDLDRTSSFLKSSLGGQWRDTEITRLLNPSRRQVDEVLGRIRAARVDYNFFLFTGHGCHAGQTQLSLNDHEKIEESAFYGIADRQLSIFDCCRVVSQVLTKALEARAMSFDSISSTRERYEQRIMQAAKQHSKLYSCSLGEVSYDSPEGAAYLGQLLAAVKAIPLGMSTMTVEEAHSIARAKTIENGNRRDERQTPAAVLPKLPRDMQLILAIK